MRGYIPGEAAIGLGLMVWLVAATIFPFHMGAGGAPWWGLGFYILIAGGLFATGDALLGVADMPALSDISGMGLMKAISLAFPAAAMFALGSLMAPAAERLEDDVCRLGGFATLDSSLGVPEWDFDADADCVPADPRRG